MKVEQFDNTDERQVLIGMIVSKPVLGRVAACWKDGGLFAGRPANELGRMCVRFFHKHNQAPLKHVENLLAEWGEQHSSEPNALKALVGLVDGLSGQYEQQAGDLNHEHVIDVAQRHFDKVRLERCAEEIRLAVAAGDFARAEEIRTASTSVHLSAEQGCFLEDPSGWELAFAGCDKPLVSYPGDLGVFFGDMLTRDSLVSFLAPEKRGKTFWLMDVAWRAMEQRCRVAFFGAGDMSQGQYFYRYAARATGRPCRPGIRQIPLGLKAMGKEVKVTGYDTKEYTKPMNADKAREAYLGVLKDRARSRGNLYWMACFPNSTLSIQKIKFLLEAKAQQHQWTPDLIVIDYADILAMPEGRYEMREKVNILWKQLKELSESHHCLVLTASQANTAAYKAELLGMGNFSEDKRKNAHVNAQVGINVSASEKKAGLCRLNITALREGDYNPLDVVHVAGCLAVANPAIVSLYPKVRRREKAPEPSGNGKAGKRLT